MNSSISIKNIICFAAMILAAFLMMSLFAAAPAFADEISDDIEAAAEETVQTEETAAVQPAAEVQASPDVQAEIAANEQAARDAQQEADRVIAEQQKAAEDARLKAEAEIEAQKAEMERQKAKAEAERKAIEEEIERKKAEEAARKEAEEKQRRFEESLTASGMSDEDFNALCKIVQAEDGHDSIEGRIGIANVILNRVRHPSYPNSIMGVLTAPGQFGPVHNGAFAAAVPSASTIAAVKEAISGRNTVGGALYFHRGSNWGGRTLVASVGSHCFFV